MRTSETDLILVPGAPVSDDHWIARWARNLKTARSLAPPSDNDRQDTVWRQRLFDAASACTRPCVVIGHGLGATQIALAASGLATVPVAAVLLVAPHDDAAFDAHAADGVNPQGLAAQRFGFPAMMITAQNNPHLPYARAEVLGARWGVPLIDAGDTGPIDETSGHGPWPEGLLRLGRLLKSLGSTESQ